MMSKLLSRLDDGRLASSYRTPYLVIRNDKRPSHEWNDTAKRLVRILAFGIRTFLCHLQAVLSYHCQPKRGSRCGEARSERRTLR